MFIGEELEASYSGASDEDVDLYVAAPSIVDFGEETSAAMPMA